MNAIASPGWTRSLAALHSRIGAAFEAWSLATDLAEIDRVRGREALTHDDLVETNRRLQGVLAPPGKAETETANDLIFVASLVASGLPLSTASANTAPDLRSYVESCGARTREVWLAEGWWRTDRGKLAGVRTQDGRPVALTTDFLGRYRIHVRGERTRRVTAAIAAGLEPNALSIVPPLPNKPLKWFEIAVIGVRLCKADLSTLALASAAASVLGLILPIASSQIVNVFIPDQLRTGVLE